MSRASSLQPVPALQPAAPVQHERAPVVADATAAPVNDVQHLLAGTPMNLRLSGGGQQRDVEWSSYALLRDNVQHFLEAGRPSDRFRALHSIEAAVDTGCTFHIDAARLRGEVLQAWYGLRKVRLSEAAISIRTRAILTRSAGQGSARGTAVAAQVGWRLPVAAAVTASLRSVTAAFVAAVLALTEAATDGDTLAISRTHE